MDIEGTISLVDDTVLVFDGVDYADVKNKIIIGISTEKKNC